MPQAVSDLVSDNLAAGDAVRFDPPAVRADLDALPPSIKGEIIDGVLYTQPRPRPRHSRVASTLGTKLIDPYDLGDGGPGGWWIIHEPGIELPEAPEIAPDIAGWRRERMPEIDPDEPISVVPDWVCEVLSPSNRSYDRTVKFPFYARIAVGWLWVVDPAPRTVEVKRLAAGRWTDLGTFSGDDVLRAEPFTGLDIPLGKLWLPTRR